MTKGAELARKLKYQVVLKSLVVLGMPFNIDIFLWQICITETSSVASIVEYAQPPQKKKKKKKKKLMQVSHQGLRKKSKIG